MAGSRSQPRVATATVVWITLASFLLTEVVAYPAFVWALLAAHVCVTRPSALTDLVAVAGIALAVLARTQFYVLAAVLAFVIVAQALTERQLMVTLRRHAVLCGVYAVGLLAVAGLSLSGHHVLGTYAQTAKGNPLPAGIFGSVPAHLAVVALAGGLLPMLVGGGWIVANLRGSESRERQAFAWLAVTTIGALTIEVASFDIRFGGSVVRERYLFYLAPVLFVALAAALTATSLPRWSVLVPLVLLAIGFSQTQLPTFEKLNADTPASILDDWLRSTMDGLWGARIFLMLAALVLTLLYVEAAVLVPRRLVVAGICAAPRDRPAGRDGLRVQAAVRRARHLRAADHARPEPRLRMGRPSDQHRVSRRDDSVRGDPRRLLGERRLLVGPRVLEPLDRVRSRSAERVLRHTPGSFPKLTLKFDPRTGRANIDPDAFVLQAVGESRFHIAGTPRTTGRGIDLDLPDRPWRAEWVSFGLYDDGWTRPDRTARIRVFSNPGQHGRVNRALTLAMSGPPGAPDRDVLIHSNAGTLRGLVGPRGATQHVDVCVPANGFADITVRVRGASPIPGDEKNVTAFAIAREGGVEFQQIALADELGTC